MDKFDRNFIKFQLDSIREYEELKRFISTNYVGDSTIIIKKQILGIDDIFTDKRKIKISSRTLENILNELIKRDSKVLEDYLRSIRNG